MESYYALYLELYALDRAGASEQFAKVMYAALVGDDVVKRVEVMAVAAMAAAEDAILIDFYDFQQRWEQLRNLAPRQ